MIAKDRKIKSPMLNLKKVAGVVGSAVKKRTFIHIPKMGKNRVLKFAVILSAFLIVGALVYRYKGVFVVATVNGKPISRLELIRVLEKQGGKQALDSIITKKLISQAAENENIHITKSEIDAEVAKIEKTLKSQNLTLDKALSFQGLTREDFIKQITLQKELEKLLAEKTAVTDKEVAKYIEDNKSSFPKGSSESDIKAQVRALLVRQKFSAEVQNWIKDVKSGASIRYFVDDFK